MKGTNVTHHLINDLGPFSITVSVPYSTGEQYEGSAQLISQLQRRVFLERQSMIDNLVQQGNSAEASSIPPILHAFTLLLFTPESKLMAYMESKRQMIPLQRYLEKYPDTDPTVFPPHRTAYIGSKQKLENWAVLVRRLQEPSPTQMPPSIHISSSGPINLDQQRSHADVGRSFHVGALTC